MQAHLGKLKILCEPKGVCGYQHMSVLIYLFTEAQSQNLIIP